jgi:RNA polymerase sigma-70 factor (ECF subfamily)
MQAIDWLVTNKQYLFRQFQKVQELNHLSDQELLNAFQEGSESAFEEIHNRYFKRLYQHASNMLDDQESAADVVQEVFIALWTKRDSLHIQKTLAGYLHSSVRNRVLNVIEHSKLYDRHLASLAEFLREAADEPAATPADREIFFQLFESEVDKLPSKMKEVFELRRKDELSYIEIADKLSISDKTVKKQINNAIKILKSRLIQWKGQLVIIFF